jgi:CBS domain-containing protein
MARAVRACRAGAPLRVAATLFWERQVLRAPVTDDAGRLVGVIALADLARCAERNPEGEDGSPSADEVARILAGVCESHGADVAA